MFENQFIGKDKYITVVAGQLKYLIEDFENLTNCFVFATKDDKLSLKDAISSDYYEFESFEGNNYITFSAGFPLGDFKIFKIVKPIDLISIPFQFDTVSSITPNALNKNFEVFQELCLVMQETFNERTFRIDGTNEDVMLPKLKNGEVWQRIGDGWQGFNVGDIEQNLLEFWKEFKERTEKVLQDIADNGKMENDKVIATGEEWQKTVTNTGTGYVDQMTDKSSEIGNKLDLIWKMYSIITGSNRYLSGNEVTARTQLEKTVNGGLISARTGEPNRIYTGGLISQRGIPQQGIRGDK